MLRACGAVISLSFREINRTLLRYSDSELLFLLLSGTKIERSKVYASMLFLTQSECGTFVPRSRHMIILSQNALTARNSQRKKAKIARSVIAVVSRNFIKNYNFYKVYILVHLRLFLLIRQQLLYKNIILLISLFSFTEPSSFTFIFLTIEIFFKF